MGVLTFLIQEAVQYRNTQTGTGLDGMPEVEWTTQNAALPCRLMHDLGQSAGGNEGGSVATPRCYFEVDSGVLEQDELVIDGERYRVEQMFARAEGGTHYDVALLRSAKQS